MSKQENKEEKKTDEKKITAKVVIRRAFGSVISAGGRQNLRHTRTGPSPFVCTSFSSYLVAPDFSRI